MFLQTSRVSVRQFLKLTRLPSTWKQTTWSHVQLPQSICCFNFGHQDMPWSFFWAEANASTNWARRHHAKHTHNDQAPLSSCTYLYLLVLKPEWRVLTCCFNYILTLTVLVSETCPRRLWAIGWLRTASPQVAHFEPEGNCLNDPPVLETYIEETQEVGDTRWRPCRCGILLLSICIDDSAAYSM